jgi:predicted metal-dependent phosphoesterase TrpH
VIDLHLHTSASDGLLTPLDLVARVAAAGVSTCSVTDHDTVAGLDAAATAAAAHGLRFLPGIEITAVADGRDVHMLGYGFDVASPQLATFLTAQRDERRLRVQRLLERLAVLGMPLDEAAIGEGLSAPGSAPAVPSDPALLRSFAPALPAPPERPAKVWGRPHIARAMMAAGYVASVAEAFDLWLGTGRPAFVPRSGATPQAVVAIVQAAGGVAALAHPGVTKRDALIPALAAAGLDALEVWHSEHDDEATERYRLLAREHGLLMTGGSDFHGDLAGRVCRLGAVGVPVEAFEALLARLARAGTATGVRSSFSVDGCPPGGPR